MTAAEAGRLEEDEACRLEDHLQGCPDCRGARGRLAGLAALLRDPPPAESRPASMERAIARALAGDRPAAARADAPTGRRTALVVAAAFIGAVAVSWWWTAASGTSARPPGPSLAAGAVEAGGIELAPHEAVPLQRELVARVPSTLSLPGASLRLESGTRVALEASGEVELREGRAHATVRQGTPFAVRTERFVARVRGTRFVVTSASVEVYAGRVDVWSLDGARFASLGPGDRWALPAETGPVVFAPVVPTATAEPSSPSVAGRAHPGLPPARPGAPRRLEPTTTSPAEASAPEPTLADVRAALRARQTARARALLDRLAGAPGISRVEVDVLHADSLRLERRFAEAVREYHAIAARHRGTAAGEAALFTAAQLELDRLGRTGDARRTLEEYRRRHPTGRFRAEVEHLLDRFGPPPQER